MNPPAQALVVVIPCLNEADRIARLVAQIIASGARCVVVDGGSSDDTLARAHAAGAQCLSAPRGRASQMNAGAQYALERLRPGYLLFLHADVYWAGRVAARDWCVQLRAAGRRWGRFDVNLVANNQTAVQRVLLGIVGRMMNLRSRLTGICTGDQGLLVDALLFRSAGAFAEQPLMEDIELTARLKRLDGAPVCLVPPLQVSARRWVERGVLRTIGQMWWYRLRYFLGASAQDLHAAYYGGAGR